MVVHSPELFGNASDVGQVTAECVDEPEKLENLFFLLASLRCLEVLVPLGQNDQPLLEGAFRKELRGSFQRLPLASSIMMWTGYERFARITVAQMNQGERDRLSVEFVLSQTSLSQLFDPSMTWASLRILGSAQFGRLVALRGGGSAVECALRASYRRQRDALVREMFLRVLPTAALWLAGLVAIGMALLFTRSLCSS